MGGLYWKPKKTFKKHVWSYILTYISVLPNNSIKISFMALKLYENLLSSSSCNCRLRASLCPLCHVVQSPRSLKPTSFYKHFKNKWPIITKKTSQNNRIQHWRSPKVSMSQLYWIRHGIWFCWCGDSRPHWVVCEHKERVRAGTSPLADLGKNAAPVLKHWAKRDVCLALDHRGTEHPALEGPTRITEPSSSPSAQPEAHRAGLWPVGRSCPVHHFSGSSCWDQRSRLCYQERGSPAAAAHVQALSPAGHLCAQCHIHSAVTRLEWPGADQVRQHKVGTAWNPNASWEPCSSPSSGQGLL